MMDNKKNDIWKELYQNQRNNELEAKKVLEEKLNSIIDGVEVEDGCVRLSDWLGANDYVSAEEFADDLMEQDPYIGFEEIETQWEEVILEFTEWAEENDLDTIIDAEILEKIIIDGVEVNYGSAELSDWLDASLYVSLEDFVKSLREENPDIGIEEIKAEWEDVVTEFTDWAEEHDVQPIIDVAIPDEC